MLIELRIENFAVIEKLALRLQPGLTVLTGETGAGKSIIVGALSLLLGERASADAVRAGASRCVVEGVFDVQAVPAVRDLLDARGIDAEDGLVILRREVAAEGRSRAWINGSASTASLTGEIGRQLVDLHGQHEHQSLLQPAEQGAMLDAFAGEIALALEIAQAYSAARTLRERLDSLDAKRREVAQRADLLRHQAGEIERAQLRPGEEAELEAEAHRLTHAEELAGLARTLHQALYAADDALSGRLDEIRRTLAQLVRLDDALAEWSKQLEDAYYVVEELGRQMGEYAARIEDDPGRLEAIRRRQDLLFRLKARYGPAIEDVIAAGERAQRELALLDDAAHERRVMEQDLARVDAQHRKLCDRLSGKRRSAARRLDSALCALLPELGMPDARFQTLLVPLGEPGAHGGEGVEFRVSVNAGFDPAPLGRVASGGELSRIMLALKASLARQDRVPTLVFDEIDAGIGGHAAQRVADCLRAVAGEHQVFVVTHLARIAAAADHHFLVEKSERTGRAATDVQELRDEARIREVSRMLGGDPESRISQAHARELLES